MILRRLTTLSLAVAVAVAGLSAPARAADQDDIARFVGAATTLFLLGKIIEGGQDDHRGKSRAGHRAPDRYKAAPGFRHQAGRGRGPGRHGAAPRRRAGRSLPAACRIETRHGPARYDGRCLHRFGYRR